MANDKSSNYEGLYTLGFWIVAGVVGITLFVLNRDYVSMFVNVDPVAKVVSGAVRFKGDPPIRGVVQVLVTRGDSRQYLASTMVDVVAEGKFSTNSLADALRLDAPLLVSAEFSGTFKRASDKEAKEQAVDGRASVYLNAAPSRSEYYRWGALGSVLLIVVLLVVLFTGTMGQKTARMLFVAMYLFTFLSLAVPILLSLAAANDDEIVKSMITSPIGLVRGTADGLPEQQWIFNIGGAVLPVASETTAAQKTVPAAQPSQAGPAAARADAAVELAVAAASAAAPAGLTADKRADSGTQWRVNGGLAVPFFVILLAMFGAGINMTLKVPEIQRSYDLEVLPAEPSMLVSLLSFPIRLLQRDRPIGTAQQRKTASDIRRELIENYMYLLSAPFLAIAMYYLLQVVAQQATKPVLVVMAFATGLVSKAVIGGIIRFAESNLPDRGPAAPKTLAEAEAALTTHTKEAEEAKAAALRLAQSEFDESQRELLKAEQAQQAEQSKVNRIVAAHAQAQAKLTTLQDELTAAQAKLAETKAAVDAAPNDDGAKQALAQAGAAYEQATQAAEAAKRVVAELAGEQPLAETALQTAKAQHDAAMAAKDKAEAALNRARARS